MKVMTVVGTRPEIIKLSRIIATIDLYMEQVLVHTGQNFDYEMKDVFFKELEIRSPDYYLETADSTTMKTIANVLVKTDEVIEKEKPEAILIYGDTNSCLAAIVAKRRKIPIFHMEAGNRCFDQRVPEEINRKIIDHISDINMPLTEHARRYLIQEGISPETIIKTGSTLREVLNYYQPKIDKSQVLKELELEKRGYFLFSAHREENIESEVHFVQLLESLNAIAKRFEKRIVVSTHPRTRKKIESYGPFDFDDKIIFMKPLGFLDYVNLQKNAYCVLSDSGTITEESALLSFPAITMRQAHERPEGMDEGVLIMSNICPDRIITAIEVVTDQYYNKGFLPKPVIDYEGHQVSDKVVRIIMSYTHYIRRTVWSENGR